MQKTIHILTGPVQSGKTTRLIAWLRYHEKCAGVLSPIIDEKRHVYSIHHEQDLQLEAEKKAQQPEEELITIGRYTFLNSSFEWARDELRSALAINPRWLIIDEVGPLELSGKGLEPMVSTILSDFERAKNHQLILVVRDTVVEQMISHYHLEGKYLIDESFLEIT